MRTGRTCEENELYGRFCKNTRVLNCSYSRINDTGLISNGGVGHIFRYRAASIASNSMGIKEDGVRVVDASKNPGQSVTYIGRSEVEG